MRRRRTTASEPETTAQTADTSEAVPADTSKEKKIQAAEAGADAPKRRRGPRKATTSPEPEDGAASAARAEGQDALPVPEQEVAARVPPKRGRRRTPAKEPEPIEEAPASKVEETVVPEPVPSSPADPQGVKASPPRKRSRTARASGASVEGGQEPAQTPPLPDPVLPEQEVKPRRTRGVRPSKAMTLVSEPPAPAYRALPDEVLGRLAETRVTIRKGTPELVVDGETHVPLWFFVNTEEGDARAVAARQIRQAYAVGIRFFTLLAHLPWQGRGGERRYAPLDDALAFVVENAPDSYLLPRLIFSPPLSWERAHANEMTHYANGETGDVSLASHAFWDEEAAAALRAAVEHVAQGPHAGRVWGFYLEHGEWFHDTTRGYDLSAPNRQAFQTWLQTRYNHDLVALRAAWHDGSVTFENAEIPPWQTADALPASAPLLYGERERRYVDFHEFSSDNVAEVILRLGRTVKEASGGRSAVAVSYGYTFELPRAGSGHLALARLLSAPQIDILTGPHSYAHRGPGRSGALPAPIDSVALAGKLWVSEDDTKTHLARGETPDTYNPKVASSQETAALHARNFGAAATHGAGISWMDLWGQGWLDDPSLWANIGRLRTISDQLATRRRNPRTKAAPPPDVAVFVDERSFFGVRADERLLKRLVADQRDVLLRSGARLGFYLLSDLLRKNFPAGPRLLLFLNAFHVPPAVRSVIKERFQSEGRTLAWVYGPGCLDGAEGMDGLSARPDGVSDLSDVIGMHLRLQAWGSKLGTIITNGRSPLTQGFNSVRGGQRLGHEERINPSFYANDARSQALGEYVQSGNPSLALRKHPAWQSVFVGELALTPALLRGLYHLAGVASYTTEDDVAHVGDSLICLHAASGGPATVVLPEEGHLFDVLSGETVAAGGRGARLHLMRHQVRLLFFGTASEVSRLGGNPSAGPPGLTPDELPPPPLPFVIESREAPAGSDASVSDEDALLMAAALAGEVSFEDKDQSDGQIGAQTMPEEVAGEVPADQDAPPAPAGKKKRRRRGRRGRGPEAAEGVGEAEDAEGTKFANEDVFAETADVTEASGRALLPLSELLPESEHLDGDLPPVPPELMPLDVEVGLLSDEEPTEADLVTEPMASRGRRRNRSRRGRGRRPEAQTQEDAPLDPPAET